MGKAKRIPPKQKPLTAKPRHPVAYLSKPTKELLRLLATRDKRSEDCIIQELLHMYVKVFPTPRANPPPSKRGRPPKAKGATTP